MLSQLFDLLAGGLTVDAPWCEYLFHSEKLRGLLEVFPFLRMPNLGGIWLVLDLSISQITKVLSKKLCLKRLHTTMWTQKWSTIRLPILEVVFLGGSHFSKKCKGLQIKEVEIDNTSRRTFSGLFKTKSSNDFPTMTWILASFCNFYNQKDDTPYTVK